MMVGTSDHKMLERIDSSVTSETLKKAFLNILLELVPFTYSISLEGTVGITIDSKQMLFLHLSDSVSKSEDERAINTAIKGSPQHVKSNSVCSRRFLGDESNKPSLPSVQHNTLSNCTNGGTKHSLLQSPLSFGSMLSQNIKTENLALAETCSNLSLEKSTAARRKNRPAKFSSDGVTVLRNVGGNRLSSVCPVTGEEEIEVLPQKAQSSYVGSEQDDGLEEVLDFSTHGKMEFFESNAPVSGYRGCSSFHTVCVDDEIENVPTRASAKNQPDQTLLRQLLLDSTKMKGAKSSKRRFSGSDDDSNKKPCVEPFLFVAENLKSESSSLRAWESDARVVGSAVPTTHNHRRMAFVKTEVKSADDAGVERRANPDSILCRLLTSGVNMYDTTEVERLRQASSNKRKIFRDRDVSQNIATSSQLDDTIVDLALNIKTEGKHYPRKDEFVDNTTKDDPLCFQSSGQHHVSNSPSWQPVQSGFWTLNCLADAAVTVQPQLQTHYNTAEQCPVIVKEERDDFVDVHRTLRVSAGDARMKENHYQMYSTKSPDLGN